MLASAIIFLLLRRTVLLFLVSQWIHFWNTQTKLFFFLPKLKWLLLPIQNDWACFQIAIEQKETSTEEAKTFAVYSKCGRTIVDSQCLENYWYIQEATKQWKVVLTLKIEKKNVTQRFECNKKSFILHFFLTVLLQQKQKPFFTKVMADDIKYGSKQIHTLINCHSKCQDWDGYANFAGGASILCKWQS